MKAFLLTITLATSLFALQLVPKQISLELGGRYSHKNELGTANRGYSALFEYSWQLSGLDNSKVPSFISVPLGMAVYPATETEPGMRIFHYGWNTRHSFLKDRNVHPYIGYGLLLNQLTIENRDGSQFGHQTRFDLGCEFMGDRRLRPFVKAEWSMARFPSLDSDDSPWIYSLDFKVGIRFFRNGRE